MAYGCKRNSRWSYQCRTDLGAERGTRLHPRQQCARGELLHRRAEFWISLAGRRATTFAGVKLRTREIERDDIDECASKFQPLNRTRERIPITTYGDQIDTPRQPHWVGITYRRHSPNGGEGGTPQIQI